MTKPHVFVFRLFLQALRFTCSVPASFAAAFPSFGYWDEGNLVTENESPDSFFLLLLLYCFIVLVIYYLLFWFVHRVSGIKLLAPLE